MLSTANPKVKPDQLSRAEAKREKRTQEAADIRACYEHVDRREGMKCRITGVHVNPYALSALERGEHHHLTYRSQGGQHTPNNVILISKWTHDEIHLRCRLRVSGDAEERDDLGRLVGVTVERLSDEGWKLWKCC